MASSFDNLASTINRRLAAVRWFVRQAEFPCTAPLTMGVRRPFKAKPGQSMARPYGTAALTHQVRVAAHQEEPAAAARN